MRNMIQKIGALFLMCTMLFVFPAAAQEAQISDLVKNGTFEEVKDGAPAAWAVSGAEFGTDALSLTEKVVHEGKEAVKMGDGKNDPIIISQVVTGFFVGEEYTLSAWLKTEKPTGQERGAGIKLEFYNGSKPIQGADVYIYDGLKTADWKELKKTFTVPEGTTRVDFQLRMFAAGGVYYWDDAKILGRNAATIEYDEVSAEVKKLPPVEGTGNILQNPDFENLNADGSLEGWSVYNGSLENNPYVALDDKVAQSGKYSIRLTNEGGKSPWVSQGFEVEPYTEYQISFWTRHEDEALARSLTSVRMKYEFYSSTNANSSTTMPYDDMYCEGSAALKARRWEQKVVTLITPPGARYLKIYPRLISATGPVWYDNFEMVMIKKAAQFTLTTDNVFYYPDQEQGFAKALLTENAKELAGGTVDFTLRDGDTVLAQQLATPLAEEMAMFKYDMKLLSQQKKAYYIDAVLKKADGTVVESITNDIYVYPRPSLIDEHGYVAEEDGTVFIPNFGYHCYSILDEAEKRGVNVPQTGWGMVAFYDDTNGEELQQKLDEIHAKGMKAFVSLYGYMRHPSDPMNRENVIKVVERFKDHPAVYAWGHLDEPFDTYTNPLPGLKETYKLVRDMDDKHPVFIMVNDDRYYSEGIKYCDIFGHDPYPVSPILAEPAVHIQTRTEAMDAYARMTKKPIQTLNQAFVYKGYTPNVQEERNMWYQALLGGGDMNGYYAIDELLELKELDAGVVEFAKEEEEVSYKMFSDDALIYNQDTNKDFSFRVTTVDGKTYLLVLNRSNEEKTVTVPLLSKNGKMTLAGGTFKEAYGCEGTLPVINKKDNTAEIKLIPRQAAVWTVENVNVKADVLAQNAFGDMDGHTWATSSVEALYKEGIVNDKGLGVYAPGENITRGDFAMFLMNALGLNYTEERRAESFADVKPEDPYYEALCVGKTFGIFKGVGDNKFNPYLPISRQDVMVICARGLRKVYRIGGDATADTLNVFSDVNSVSDYAEAFVAQMVKDGFIAGNADGTLNPLGNMTRAEAAVLMERILSSTL